MNNWETFRIFERASKIFNNMNYLLLNKPGRYVCKAIKAIFKPENLVITGVTALTLLSPGKGFSQSDRDTIWGQGIFLTKNIETIAPVGNINLYLTPKSMNMIVPDTTWMYNTDNGGGAQFNLPVYIDTTTTSLNSFIKESSLAFPNPGSEITVCFPQQKQGEIEFISLDGKTQAKQSFNSHRAYLPLQQVSSGIGVYKISTSDGEVITGKYVKINTPLQGPAPKPISQAKNKLVPNVEATYQVKWVDPDGDFETDSIDVVLQDGNNGFMQLFLTPVYVPPPTNNQDISGFAVDDKESGYAPLANASIEAYVPATGQLFTTVSASDGFFKIDSLPLGKEVYFSAGNIEGRGSIVDFIYTTPSEIVNPSDSINPHFGVVLPQDVELSSWNHTQVFNLHNTNQEIVKYYVGNSFPDNEEAMIDGYYIQLQSDLENKIQFEKSLIPLNDEGINIEKGTYNTNTFEEGFYTPLGNILNPVKYANSTMGVGDYVNFVHETLFALGYNGVSWYSVMRIDSPDFTQEDKNILNQVSSDYYKAVYQDGKTHISIKNMRENMDESAGAKAKLAGRVRQEINQ